MCHTLTYPILFSLSVQFLSLYVHLSTSNDFRPVLFIYHPHYVKSPPPYGEGLNFRPNHLYTAYRSAVNFQPDHLYITYRSVVNFLCTYILARTKQKVNRTFYYNFMLIRHELCNISTPIKQIYNQANCNFVLSG